MCLLGKTPSAPSVTLMGLLAGSKVRTRGRSEGGGSTGLLVSPKMLGATDDNSGDRTTRTKAADDG
jgi:hypothetical protein